MNPLAWLLARLRRPQPTPSAPAAVQSTTLAAPLPAGNFFTPLGAAAKPASPTPRPPLTEAERWARQQQRQEQAERWLAVGLTWENTKMLTPELHRLVIARNFLHDDEAEARANGWGAELLRVQLEAQELEATIQLKAWQHTLIIDHGEEVGRKLGQHQVEVGMSAYQLFASYGEPAPGAITFAADEPGHCFVRYGSEATGSYFELADGVVTLAVLGLPTLPAHVLDSPPVGEWPVP